MTTKATSRSARPASRLRTPTLTDRLERIDELNLGRLGLICVQERIPDDYTRWEVAFEVDGQPAQLSCVAPSEFGGVPHGLDGDILNGILAIFLEQGAPESGEVLTTPHQILQRAGLDTGGRYYQVLRASLHRLNSAKFVTQNAWRAHGQRRWTTQTFSLVEGLAYDSDDQTLGKGSVIHIRLPKPLVMSVRSKFIKPLDPILLEQLERPLARSVYRLLDAKRYDPTDPQVITMELHMSLISWGQECKLKDLVPSRIKRTLEKAHDDLKACGYLLAVEYQGLGSGQEIVYRFGDGSNFGMDLAARITQYGVGHYVAQGIVQTVPREDLLHRLAKAEFLLRRDRERIQNRAGFVVTVLKDDGVRYPDPEGFVSPTAVSDPPPPPRPWVEEDVEVVRRVREEELRAQPRAAQADAILARLRLLCGVHVVKMGTPRMSAIHQAITEGVLDAVVVEREMMTAVFEGRTEAFLKALVREASDRRRQGQGALLEG
ncbi:replication initiator protein A [Deinococcus budaensis]|uniref:replication initiator protein A n=1 Tax=Deinococcus budaensis TaxID=1665626 RepID=UPI0035F2DE64